LAVTAPTIDHHSSSRWFHPLPVICEQSLSGRWPTWGTVHL